MIINAKKILEDASNKKYAVCQFNINNLEWTRFILEECEANKAPVILGVSSGAIKYMGGYNTVVNIVKSLTEDLKITIPIVIHLDHGTSFDTCKSAIDAGFTSVMIDASKFSLEENIRKTKEVVDYAKKFNVTVEAEIGHIGGNEDGIKGEVLYANIDECVELTHSTNIDILAAAVGSSHGLYKGTPKLNLKLISNIKDKVKIPLVLHGGSGIPDDQIKIAINNGINKININTDLQVVWTDSVRNFLNQNKEEYDPRKIIKSGEEAIKKVVKDKLILTNSINRY